MVDHSVVTSYVYGKEWGEPFTHPGPSMIRADDPAGHTFRCYPQKLVEQFFDRETYEEELARRIL